MPGNGPSAFFDANVLLCLAGHSETKALEVERLLDIGGTTSVQVLNEVVNVARRKFKWPWQTTIDLVERLRFLLTIVPVTLDVHVEGLRLAQRHQLSIFDSMIVAAALGAGCDMLYSEDMHHGLVVDRQLRIHDPFRAA